MSADEAATAGVSAQSGSTTLGSTTVRLDAAGSKTVTLKLTRGGPASWCASKRKLKVA